MQKNRDELGDRAWMSGPETGKAPLV